MLRWQYFRESVSATILVNLQRNHFYYYKKKEEISRTKRMKSNKKIDRKNPDHAPR